MKHLLLIKDNNSLRKEMVHSLELADYRVTSASSVKSCIKKALLHHPHLIIWDMLTPPISIHQFISTLDNKFSLRLIPFIFLTGKDTKTELNKIDTPLIVKYLDRPFTTTVLLDTIEDTLASLEIKQKNLVGGTGNQDLNISNAASVAMRDFTKNRNIEHYKKKQVIYAEGNHPLKLFYIEKGKIKIIKTNNDGKELTVGLYGEGDFVGYTALMEGTNYKDTAQAIDESDIAVIPKEEFEELMHNNGEAAQVFIRLLAKNFSEKEEQLIGLAYNSLRKRVADALITIQHIYCKAAQAPFSMHISREDLANIAGTATESLIRTLSDFKNEKLIKIKDGNIIIPDPGKLQRLLN